MAQSIGSFLLKILGLLALIGVLILAGLFITTRLGFFQMNLLSSLPVIGVSKMSTNMTNPGLVMLERQQSERLRLDKVENDLKAKQSSLDTQLQDLERRKSELDAREEDLIKRQKAMEEASVLSASVQASLISVANMLMNMPPENARDILVGMSDEQQVIAILFTVNKLSLEQRRASLVPVWLQMMEPEKSANLVRKMSMQN